MRVLENKIILCNGFGKIFVLACDIQDQLNLECSFSLPSVSISRKKPIGMSRIYVCVTHKREVIIAQSHGKEQPRKPGFYRGKRYISSQSQRKDRLKE